LLGVVWVVSAGPFLVTSPCVRGLVTVVGWVLVVV
jgi:hypothetical protein